MPDARLERDQAHDAALGEGGWKFLAATRCVHELFRFRRRFYLEFLLMIDHPLSVAQERA
jgi:hypothetical protein